MDLNERKMQILKSIIDEYIDKGEPVGSKHLVEYGNISLSPATIRNEMSELEEMGYLDKPHTSAGRIPSQAGYRLYVNELMNQHKLTMSEMDALNSSLRMRMQELEETVQSVSRIVSQLTQYTTVALLADTAKTTIRKYELVFVDPRTVIAVLVTNSTLVKNKYLKTSFSVSEEELHRLSNLLNARLAGLTLDQISFSLIKTVEHECGVLAPLAREIMDFAAEILSGENSDVYVGGTANILRHPEYRDPEKAQMLLDYVTEPHNFARLAQGMGESGVLHVKIGSENPEEPLRDASLVYGTYGISDQLKGVIGVVGPTRMDYARVAANLNYFIRGFNKLLEQTFLEHPDR